MVIHSNDDFIDLIQSNVEIRKDIEVIPRDDSESAIALLEILPNIKIIITEIKTEENNTLAEIQNYVDKTNRDILIVPVSDKISEEISKKYEYTISPTDWKIVLELIDNILKIKKESIEDRYKKIPLRYMGLISTACCDIFRKENSELYKVIIKNGQEVSKESIKALSNQGIEELYIYSEYQINFTNLISDFLVNKIEKSLKDLPTEKKITLLGQSFSIAMDEITKTGINSATIQLSESIISAFIDTCSSQKKPSELIRKIINSKTGILYQNAFIITTVATALLESIQEKSMIQKSQKILTNAAFFHDISLSEYDQFSTILTKNQFEQRILDIDARELIFDHAKESANLIDKIIEIPAEVSRVIIEHHGSLSGLGFTNVTDKKVSLLSKIFIIAEFFTVELLQYSLDKKETREIYKNLQQRFICKEGDFLISNLKNIFKK